MNEVVKLCGEQVWIWPGACFNMDGLLVMDSKKTHLTDKTKEVYQAQRSKIAIIPVGLTVKLKPLDCGGQQVFQNIHVFMPGLGGMDISWLS